MTVDTTSGYTFTMPNTSVTVTVVYEYTVTKATETFTLEDGDKNGISSGEFVKTGDIVSVIPEGLGEIATLKVVGSSTDDPDGDKVTVTGVGSFVMPNFPVTVSVEYEYAVTKYSNYNGASDFSLSVGSDTVINSVLVGKTVTISVTELRYDYDVRIFDITNKEITNDVTFANGSTNPIVELYTFVMPEQPVQVVVTYYSDLSVEIEPNTVSGSDANVTVNTDYIYASSQTIAEVSGIYQVPFNSKITLTAADVAGYVSHEFTSETVGVSVYDNAWLTVPNTGIDIDILLTYNEEATVVPVFGDVIVVDGTDTDIVGAGGSASTPFSSNTAPYEVSLDLTGISLDYVFDSVTVEDGSGGSITIQNPVFTRDGSTTDGTLTMTLVTPLGNGTDEDKLSFTVKFVDKTVIFDTSTTSNWMSGGNSVGTIGNNLVTIDGTQNTDGDYKVVVSTASLTGYTSFPEEEFLRWITVRGGDLVTNAGTDSKVPSYDDSAETITFYVTVDGGVDKISFDIVCGYTLTVEIEQVAGASALYSITEKDGSTSVASRVSTSESYFVEKSWDLELTISDIPNNYKAKVLNNNTEITNLLTTAATFTNKESIVIWWDSTITITFVADEYDPIDVSYTAEKSDGSVWATGTTHEFNLGQVTQNKADNSFEFTFTPSVVTETVSSVATDYKVETDATGTIDSIEFTGVVAGSDETKIVPSINRNSDGSYTVEVSFSGEVTELSFVLIYEEPVLYAVIAHTTDNNITVVSGYTPTWLLDGQPFGASRVAEAGQTVSVTWSNPNGNLSATDIEFSITENGGGLYPDEIVAAKPGETIADGFIVTKTGDDTVTGDETVKMEFIMPEWDADVRSTFTATN